MVKRISLVIVMFFVCAFSGVCLFAQDSGLRNVEALMLKGAYSQAARECERFLAGRHRAAIECKAHYLLGICLLKEERYDEARKNFDIILRRFPRSKFCDDAKLSIADSYLLEGDYNQASPYAGSYFSVQVGCFGNKTNAEKLRGKLISKGYQAYILELPGDGLYRVRVGKLSSRPEAGSLERRLKAAGYSTKVCP